MFLLETIQKTVSQFNLPTAIMADKRIMSIYKKYNSDKLSDSVLSINNESEGVTYNFNPTQNSQSNLVIQKTQERDYSSDSERIQNNDKETTSTNCETEDLDESQPLTCRQRSRNTEQTINKPNQPDSEIGILDLDPDHEVMQDGNAINSGNFPSAYTCNSDNDIILQNLRAMESQKSNRPTSSASNTIKPLTPTNHTLQSIGKGTVILIKFSDDDCKVLTNPILINKLIVTSEFKHLKIKDIRPNNRKNILAIEAINPLTTEETEKLTNITKLGTYEVKCEVPNSDKFKYGVIYPISLDTDLLELQYEINETNEIQIVGMERLKKKINNNWTPSQSVKLTIKNRNIPNHITIGFMKYIIRPFINEPMQCYKCQRLGHTSKSCKASLPRCMLCGGPHKKDDCTAERKRCANCNGEHSANSKSCEIMRQALNLEKLKAIHEIDHNTARNQMFKNKYEFQASSFPPSIISPILETPTETQPFLNTSYANIVSRGTTGEKSYSGNRRLTSLASQPVYQQTPLKAVYKDAETQTDYVEQQKTLDEDFLKKLRNFIIDILSTNLTKETKDARLCLADNAIKNNFGIDLRKTGSTKNPINSEKENKTVGDKKRKRGKNNQKDISASDLNSSAESEGVISDPESIWETVEKKQVKRNLRSQNKNANKVQKQQ